MPRTGRVLINNSCYHIVNRGNQKREVFLEKEDFERYLFILRKAKLKHKVKLVAYCLMPNHVHLMIHSLEAINISHFMHYLSLGYTAYFNKKYEKVGHLWQGRFKSHPLLTENFLLHVANYIEFNPVRAKIVDDPAKYSWSSYKKRCLLASNSFIDPVERTESIPSQGTGPSSILGQVQS